MRIEKNRLGDAELYSESRTEPFLLSPGRDEASIDRVYSRLRSISCDPTRKMYHLSHDQKYLPISESDQTEAQTFSSLPIHLFRRTPAVGAFFEKLHSSCAESGQVSTRIDNYLVRYDASYFFLRINAYH